MNHNEVNIDRLVDKVNDMDDSIINFCKNDNSFAVLWFDELHKNNKKLT